MTDRKKLAFGLREIPEDLTTAWGARWIWPDDLVHDRQDLIGDDAQRLLDWLNAGAPEAPSPIGAARVRAREMALTHELRPNDDRTVTLFEDEFGIVRANPQGSHGYLYVAAWLKA